MDVDPGTAAVVTVGFRFLHDPHGLLARLAAAVLSPAVQQEWGATEA